MSEEELILQTRENTEAIARLELAVYGDGGDFKGLIRRVDLLERDVKFIQKQNWAIIVMLLGLYAAFMQKLLVP